MLYGYAGKILRVDLTTGALTDIDSSKYLPEWVGGIGLGWRILWDETNADTTEWSPENTLIFACGPLAGSPLPTSTRMEVVGIAPQGYPICWAAQSGAGGDFAPKMKWAGYDAIIVTGKSETWKYLYIDETGPQLLDATSFVGMGTYTVQSRLQKLYGTDIAAFAIGQAGENKLRIASIESNSENSFGQGGFGAVMGDKKIKCICVKPGSNKITFADPEGVLALTQKISYEFGPVTPNNPISLSTTEVFRDHGSYTSRRMSCPYSNCQASIHDGLYWTYNKVPGGVTTGSYSGTGGCAAASGLTRNMNTTGLVRQGCTTEFHNYMSNYGIGTWSGVFGGVIRNAITEGKIDKLCGMPVNASGQLSPEDNIKFWRMVVNRDGDEAFAWGEGPSRTSDLLGPWDFIWKDQKHGYTNHWDGRNQGPRFPMWVGAALKWAVANRDPWNDAHGWVERVPWWVKEWGGKGGALAGKDMMGRDAIPYDDLCVAAAKLYGTTGVYKGNNCPDVLKGYPGLPDDSLGYKDLEYAIYWHDHKESFKNCLVVCDCILPILFSSEGPDNLGFYTFEEESFKAALVSTVILPTASNSGKKVINMYRAFAVRQGRDRAQDESVIRYFAEIPSGAGYQGVEEEHYLKPDKFIALLERFYKLRGWDVATGWPTRAKLESLGLDFVVDKLAAVNKLP